MIKRFFSIVIVALMLNCFVFSASAYTDAYIADYGEKLSYTEIEELEALAADLENDYGVCVMLSIVDDTEGMTDEEYAQQIYTEYTDNENGLILLHNDAEKTYAVFVSGNAEEYLDDDAIEVMRKYYDSSNTYYDGIYAYYDTARDYLENGSPDGAYDGAYDEDYEDDVEAIGTTDEKAGVDFIWLPVSLGVGLLVGFLIINSIASKNKSVRMQKNATVYTRPGSLVITGSADNYLYSNTERREKPKQQNNK